MSMAAEKAGWSIENTIRKTDFEKSDVRPVRKVDHFLLRSNRSCSLHPPVWLSSLPLVYPQLLTYAQGQAVSYLQLFTVSVDPRGRRRGGGEDGRNRETTDNRTQPHNAPCVDTDLQIVTEAMN